MEYLPSTDSFKSLWKRPGGGFAKFTGILAIGGLGFVFCKYLLPFLVAATANLLVFIAELVALGAVIFLLTNKQVHRAISLTWLQVMRKIYGLIVNIDPIAILQNGINEMKKKLEVVNENVTRLESLLVSMKKKLKEYKVNFEDNVRKRNALQNKIKDLIGTTDELKYKAQLQLINNEITRGEQQIRAQSERIITSEKYLDIMKKLQIAADFKVRDAQGELSYRKDEYEQAKAQQKAMSSISSILKGGLTKSMEEEIAMEQVSNTINTSIAEINRLLDGSNDILINFELNSEANAAKADEIVKMFDTNGFSIFNSETEPQITFAGKNGGVKALNEPKKEMVLLDREGNALNEQKYF